MPGTNGDDAEPIARYNLRFFAPPPLCLNGAAFERRNGALPVCQPGGAVPNKDDHGQEAREACPQDAHRGQRQIRRPEAGRQENAGEENVRRKEARRSSETRSRQAARAREKALDGSARYAALPEPSPDPHQQYERRDHANGECDEVVDRIHHGIVGMPRVKTVEILQRLA